MTTWTYDDGSTMSDDGGVISSTNAPAGNLLSDLWNPNRTGMAAAGWGGLGGNWESSIQSAGAQLLGLYGANQQAKNNFELEKLKLQQRGSTGQFFTEGQPTATGSGLQLNGGTLLLIGAAVLAFVLSKD